MYFKDLFEVITIALACMMLVNIAGIWYTPVKREVIYECDVRMSNHVLTVPCTIRGKYYAV